MFTIKGYAAQYETPMDVIVFLEAFLAKSTDGEAEKGLETVPTAECGGHTTSLPCHRRSSCPLRQPIAPR